MGESEETSRPASELTVALDMPSARVLADQASIIQDLDVTGVGQLGGLASELAKQTAIKATSQQESVLSDAQKLDIGRLYGAPPL